MGLDLFARLIPDTDLRYVVGDPVFVALAAEELGNVASDGDGFAAVATAVASSIPPPSAASDALDPLLVEISPHAASFAVEGETTIAADLARLHQSAGAALDGFDSAAAGSIPPVPGETTAVVAPQPAPPIRVDSPGGGGLPGPVVAAPPAFDPALVESADNFCQFQGPRCPVA